MKTRTMLCLSPSGPHGHLREQVSGAGWNMQQVSNTEAARELIQREQFRVGVALFERYDERLHREMEGFLPSTRDMEWIALLDQSCLDHESCCRLVSATCYDYHTLPADPLRLLNTLGHAYGLAHLRNRSAKLAEPPGQYEMVGTSQAMKSLFANIRKVSLTDAAVLLTGESGTGKELTALAIHERSPRAKAPFIAVNCGALPPNLIQSELFGHEKGAFTGAHRRKIGRIEAAAGGTIFLDEIGDLAPDLQVNLLRFLQEQTIERVGSTESIQVNARVVAATHVDLERAVREGRFREDLYYRLAVLHLHIPSLSQRREDVEVLARFFFEKFSRDRSTKVKGFTDSAFRSMNGHDWPGNVRELINRVRRAMVMSEGRMITPSDLGLERNIQRHARRIVTLNQARAEAEKTAIQQSLELTRNNISQAARELGISRVTLYRFMAKHNIAP